MHLFAKYVISLALLIPIAPSGDECKCNPSVLGTVLDNSGAPYGYKIDEAEITLTETPTKGLCVKGSCTIVRKCWWDFTVEVEMTQIQDDEQYGWSGGPSGNQGAPDPGAWTFTIDEDHESADCATPVKGSVYQIFKRSVYRNAQGEVISYGGWSLVGTVEAQFKCADCVIVVPPGQ